MSLNWELSKQHRQQRVLDAKDPATTGSVAMAPFGAQPEEVGPPQVRNDRAPLGTLNPCEQ